MWHEIRFCVTVRIDFERKGYSHEKTKRDSKSAY